jgi:DNA-binding Lrp family transcriptional regulator
LTLFSAHFYTIHYDFLSMVDEIDEKILGLLEENARMSYVEIGNSVGLSEGAVRNRIQSLVNDDVIKKFTIEKSTSHGVRALTMLSVNPSVPTYEVSKMVSELDGVERIYEVTGEYDIVLVSSSPNIDGINLCIEDIRKIPGVEKTNTIIVLRTV